LNDIYHILHTYTTKLAIMIAELHQFPKSKRWCIRMI